MLVPPTGSDSYHCEASSSSSDQVKVFQGNLAKVRFAPLKTQNYIYDTYWTVRGIQHSSTVTIILFHHTVHRHGWTLSWDWVRMDGWNVYSLLLLLLVDYFTLDVIVFFFNKD